MKTYNTTTPAISRRKAVITRLEEQLKSGRKKLKKSYAQEQTLEPEDKARIGREIETLKQRI